MTFAGEEGRFVSAGCAVFFGLMLCADAAFIVASAVENVQGLPRSRWHVAQEGGIAEQWQWVKWGALALLLGLMAMSGSAVYLAWAAVFLYLLLDDSQAIHETYGWRLGQALGLQPAFGLRARDFGELMVTALAAVPLFGFLALAYRTSRADARRFTRAMLALAVLLAIFGVGVDMLEIALPAAATVLNLVEDGGEMVVASAMVAYALQCAGSMRRRSVGL
jgi:hypothetical protein